MFYFFCLFGEDSEGIMNSMIIRSGLEKPRVFMGEYLYSVVVISHALIIIFFWLYL